jgi:hypothetical protein
VLWPAHGMRRVEVLLVGRTRCGTLPDNAIGKLGHVERFEVGGDVKRLDVSEFADLVLIEPGEPEADLGVRQ